MHRIYFLLRQIFTAIVVTLLAHYSLPAMAERDEVAFFSGRISKTSVSEFLAKNGGKQLREIVIFSDGGEVLPAITLGHWISERRINLRVRGLCMSACANYIFTAASHKFIEKGALVLWHGSAEQKDFRELQERYEIISERQAVGQPLTEEDSDYLVKKRIAYLGIVEARKAQRKFFDTIRVNEEITRLGQEPHNFGIDSWTATVELMRLHGIDNVEASEDYGTVSYIQKHPLFGLLLGGRAVTFDLHENTLRPTIVGLNSQSRK